MHDIATPADLIAEWREGFERVISESLDYEIHREAAKRTAVAPPKPGDFEAWFAEVRNIAKANVPVIEIDEGITDSSTTIQFYGWNSKITGSCLPPRTLAECDGHCAARALLDAARNLNGRLMLCRARPTIVVNGLDGAITDVVAGVVLVAVDTGCRRLAWQANSPMAVIDDSLGRPTPAD